MALKSLGADVNAPHKTKDCCDDCRDGKDCCGDSKASGSAAIGGARARGEAAARSSAQKTAAAVQRRYGYSNPSSPGVRVVVKSALQEHASKLASTMPKADRRAFIDGYMSAAEPIVFRTGGSRASGAITKTTGTVMMGAGVAALAGAGVAYLALRPKAQ